MSETIASQHFKTGKAGPHLLVMGAIHGNETCGPTAILEIMAEIGAGKIPLLKGEVTFIPVCNPKAYAQNVRFIEHNLNRIFKPHTHPQTYEARLANQLTPYVDACDYLLDLHSMQASGKPFVFLDYEEPAFTDFTLAQGVDIVVRGWPQVQSAPDSLNESDTVAYARQQGKVATLVECGQNGSPLADIVARQCILGSLATLGLIAPEHAVPLPPNVTNIRVTRLIIRKKEGEFVKAWKHLDPIAAGEVIATYADGTSETAPEPGYLIMPHQGAELGHEWFYYGVEE